MLVRIDVPITIPISMLLFFRENLSIAHLVPVLSSFLLLLQHELHHVFFSSSRSERASV